MKFIAGALAATLAVAALAGCNSGSGPVSPPQIAGAYGGLMRVFTQLDTTKIDTLTVSAHLTQTGGNLSGTWTAMGKADTLRGTFPSFTVGTLNSRNVAAVSVVFQVSNPAGCTGTLATSSASVTPQLGASGWVLDARLSGSLACLHGGASLLGDLED